MKNIGTLAVSNKIFKMVDENLHNHPTAPMAFYITDYNGSNRRAFNKMVEICEYLEKNFGAVAKQIESYCTHVTFEITDPVCAQLESFLKSKGTYQEWE